MLPPCPVDKHRHGCDAADGDEDEGGEQHPGVVAHQPRHQHAADDGAEDAVDDKRVLVRGAADDDVMGARAVDHAANTVKENCKHALGKRPQRLFWRQKSGHQSYFGIKKLVNI